MLYTVGVSNIFPLNTTDENLDQNVLFGAIHRFTQLLFKNDTIKVSHDHLDKIIETLYSLTSYKTWSKYWVMLKRQLTYLVETCQPGTKHSTPTENNTKTTIYIKHKIWLTLRGQVAEYLIQNSQTLVEYTTTENVMIYKFLMMPIALNTEPVIKIFFIILKVYHKKKT